MRTKVYISGPLTTGRMDELTNVRVAVDAAKELIAAGYAPLCPQLTHYIDPDAEIAHAVWMEVDLPWVASADVVLRLPGESKGATIEVEYARKCGVPVVYSLAGVMEVTGWQTPTSKP